MAKILLVDDDAIIRSMLRLNLEKAGHEVIELENGAQVEEIMAQQHPNILVTDVFMPEHDGLETLIGIRKQSLDFPVIVITGGYDRLPGNEYMTMARDFGANEVMMKPIDTAKLLYAIDHYTLAA